MAFSGGSNNAVGCGTQLLGKCSATRNRQQALRDYEKTSSIVIVYIALDIFGLIVLVSPATILLHFRKKLLINSSFSEMTIFNLYMFDRQGVLIYYGEWNRKRQSGMTIDEVSCLVSLNI